MKSKNANRTTDNWQPKRQALALAVGAALTLSGQHLSAATIMVDEGAVDQVDNSNCSLIEAIQSATMETSIDACVAGNNDANNGGDIIVLPANSTFTLTQSYDDIGGNGDTGLPNITDKVMFQGNGATILRGGPGSDCISVLGGIALEEAVIVSGGWISTCPSVSRPRILPSSLDNDDNIEVGSFAKYYTFTLSETQEVFIDLDASVNTSLSLFSGGALPNINSTALYNGSFIFETLDAGTYTIEATTVDGGLIGDFDLTVSIGSNPTVSAITDRPPGAFRFFHVAASGDLTLQDVSLEGGHAAGEATEVPGGGAIVNFGSLSLIDSRLLNNTSSKSGGAISNGMELNFLSIIKPQGEVIISNSELSGNTVTDDNITTGQGGGIASFLGTVSIINGSDISNNHANFGGGISATTSEDGSLLISNSTITGNSAGFLGGGISTSGEGSNSSFGSLIGLGGIGGTVTITESTISNNSGTFTGGVSISGEGNINIIDATVANNRSLDLGGGITMSAGGNVLIQDSTISGNISSGSASGILNRGAGFVRIVDSLISENGHDFGSGQLDAGTFLGGRALTGGIYNQIGTMTIQNSDIMNNSVSSDTPLRIFGGGIHNGGDMLIENSRISGNSVSVLTTSLDSIADGGGIFNGAAVAGDARLIISGSIVSGNSSNGNGGGILNSSRNGLAIVNSTISGNEADGRGGGIFNGGFGNTLGNGTLVLSNSTVHSNYAGAIGGGLFNDGDSISGSSFGSVAFLNASIITNSLSGLDCANEGTLQSNNTWIGNANTSCDATFTGNPRLGALDNNGGDTLSYEPLPDSQVINLMIGPCSSGDNLVDPPSIGPYSMRTLLSALDQESRRIQANGVLISTGSTATLDGVNLPDFDPMAIALAPNDLENLILDFNYVYASVTGEFANVIFRVRPAINADGSVSDEFTGEYITEYLNVDQRGEPRDADCDLGAIEIPPIDPGTIQFEQPDYVFNETDGSVTIKVIRTGQADGVASIKYQLISDTAIVGDDYTDASEVLTWNAGETGEKVITLDIIDDDEVESEENLTIELSNPIPNTLTVVNNIAAVTIEDDEESGTIGFTQENYTYNESEGFVTITVTRSGQADGTAHIQYILTDESAVDGEDYRNESGTLSWSNGQMGDKTFSVRLFNDNDVEGTERLRLNLIEPAPTELMIERDTAFLTITDDDSFNPGIVGFSQPDLSLSEADGSIFIDVSREGGADGEASVDYVLRGDTATAGSDYVERNGTLTWGDGDSNTKTFELMVVDDALVEGNETLTLTLRNRNPSELVLDTDTATITIVDNDPTGQPGLGFDLNTEQEVFVSTRFADLLDGEEVPTTFQLDKFTKYRATIHVDVGTEHEGEPADILLLALYRPLNSPATPYLFFHKPGGNWDLLLPGAFPAPVESMSALPDTFEIVIDDGQLTGTGVFTGEFLFYGGYLLPDGTLVFNGEPGAVQHWIMQ